ncbi:amidohydrolase family protein [Mycobacterium sp. OTB74]|uniref:amidohydrolase family protein n=1 Tax=Mycobacterium sp. OTB74 TaxID=1853452 RepID=UPI002473BD22|nr:amidohydrolase family protein [Mycobacterium sp. OTB74]MDH6246466.1 putative TIM-barrel fold metal-dependent hydrolase [Mycobacterium sp. OTB74]
MSGVIDIMNYAPYVAPGLSGTEYQYEEFQTMMRTTLRPLLRDGIVTTQWGREVKVDDPPTEADPTLHLEQAIAQLDREGCDAIVLACLKMWSHHHHHQLIIDMPEEVVAEAVKVAGDRFIGAAGYNPFRIAESLQRIETFVRDYGFKYVYFHPMTFGIAPNDRRCYPLYAKCLELGIPVGMQVGHSAETLPSNVGHPMLVDDVAIEFPDLKINLSHTGWPWTGEFISMMWRHPNVYGDISAYFPKTLDPGLVRAMDRQLRGKIMLGSNGFDLTRCVRELQELPVKDQTKERIMRGNAIEFLGL